MKMKFAMLGLAFVVALGFGGLALASGPNPDCPDADGDGICNGNDPDYVPGVDCTNPDCPDDDGDGICNCVDPDYVPGTSNPDCADDDGDGICNGEDPDYTCLDLNGDGICDNPDLG